MAEVEVGKLAQQRGFGSQVEQFARAWPQDHGKANDALQQLASTKGVQLPAALDKKHQNVVDRLQKMDGAQFDKAYMSDMVDSHKGRRFQLPEAGRFEPGRRDQAFAVKTLPVLQEHLKRAEIINAALRKTGK